MYNRKHWNFIAETIKEERQKINQQTADRYPEARQAALDQLTWSFADKFLADNPKFNTDKFFSETVEGVRKRGL